MAQKLLLQNSQNIMLVKSLPRKKAMGEFGLKFMYDSYHFPFLLLNYIYQYLGWPSRLDDWQLTNCLEEFTDSKFSICENNRDANNDIYSEIIKASSDHNLTDWQGKSMREGFSFRIIDFRKN